MEGKGGNGILAPVLILRTEGVEEGRIKGYYIPLCDTMVKSNGCKEKVKDKKGAVRYRTGTQYGIGFWGRTMNENYNSRALGTFLLVVAERGKRRWTWWNGHTEHLLHLVQFLVSNTATLCMHITCSIAGVDWY